MPLIGRVELSRPDTPAPVGFVFSPTTQERGQWDHLVGHLLNDTIQIPEDEIMYPLEMIRELNETGIAIRYDKPATIEGTLKRLRYWKLTEDQDKPLDYVREYIGPNR